MEPQQTMTALAGLVAAVAAHADDAAGSPVLRSGHCHSAAAC